MATDYKRLSLIAYSTISLCKQRGWPLTWDHRLAYLMLESSEFTEAIRGKGANPDPVKEAGDVMIAVLAMIEAGGVSIVDAMKSAEATLAELELAAPYESEKIKESPRA